jgi:hypothetical protein
MRVVTPEHLVLPYPPARRARAVDDAQVTTVTTDRPPGQPLRAAAIGGV